jgi:putative ABC transport system permease protein
VVTFRGVPPEDFQRQRRQSMHILEGSWAAWLRRSDAALIGEVLARRRGAKIGGTLDAAGITVYVAGIVRSDAPQEQNVGYVHLPFLQQSADKRLGIVTQFNVKVHSHDDLERVAAAIDEQFRNEREPTQTSSEQAFVGRAAKDIVEIVEFARWPALACLAAVLALVGNAIVLSVRDRVREHAVLQTLGFKSGLIARLILAEGLLLGAAGGLLGVATLGLVLYFGAFSLTTDAVSIPFQMEVGLLITGVLLAAALGALAGLFPAWQASRREVVESLRAV